MKIKSTILIALLASCVDNVSIAQTSYQMSPGLLKTRWAKDVRLSKTHNEYPRPQLVRNNWQNLNGLWDYAVTSLDNIIPATADGKILVPYPIESALSGVKKSLQPDQLLWYKRNLVRPVIKPGEKILLHFGAVDWEATVYVNGKEVVKHTGGYTAFEADVTSLLQNGNNELVVKVYDPTNNGIGPSGKQVLNPSNIYYTPSSGIWQTVWMEIVPADYIESLVITPDVDKALVNITVKAAGSHVVQLSTANKIVTGKTNTRISLPLKNTRLWSPSDPYLYDLKVTMGKDIVKSYFGMRKISIGKDEKGIERIMLNNKYTYNLGTLDQGFWPDGLYTAPTDEALAFDIKAIKAMGFNTIRKHIKVEPARWYYYADKLGMMVWQDMVNPNQGLPDGAKEQFENESKEIISQLHNYPSITTWVLFNERWGAYDQERLTKWMKQEDPSRLVNGHSGELLYVNDQLREPSDKPYAGADMTDVHSYPEPRMPLNQTGKAMVCGEFGGIGVAVFGHQWNDLKGWGYVEVQPAELEGKYANMVKQLKEMEAKGLSGSIYTQPFDVEGEENGLMTYDREIIKIPVNRLREIHGQLIDLKPEHVDAGFHIGKDLDLSDTDDRYPEFQKSFAAGKRDSAFLRRLTLMALRKKDQQTATSVGNAFIETLKVPFDKENVKFIYQVTRSSQDAGFKLMMLQPYRVNAVMSTGLAESKIKSIIGVEEIDPKIQVGEPDFEAIIQTVEAKYGKNWTEYVNGKAMAFYWRLFIKDGNKAVKYADLLGHYYQVYFETALTNPEYMINNVSWKVFQYVNDPDVIAFAAKVMEYSMERWYQYDPTMWDTYANLLYKSGQKEKAIFWQKQAVRATQGKNQNLLTALQKMEKGLPTWGTN